MFVFKVLLITSQATEHGKLAKCARGQSSGHVLDVILTHLIRHVRLDPQRSPVRASSATLPHRSGCVRVVGHAEDGRHAARRDVGKYQR
jgi:hypothetical protein